MTVVSVVAMLVAGAGMMIGVAKYKGGSNWGRPVAVLCALVALICALGNLFGRLSGSDSEHLITIEEEYNRVRGEYLGRHLASNYAGSTAIVLQYPAEHGNSDAHLIAGLKKGCGSAVLILDVVPFTIPEEVTRRYAASAGPADDSGMDAIGMIPEDEWFTAKRLDEVIAGCQQHADIVVTLAGLPKDWFRSKVLRSKAPPVLVLGDGSVHNLRRAIAGKHIEAVVTYDPRRPYIPEMPPRNLDEAFAQRYLLITPDNVAKIAADVPGIFSE